MDIKLVANPELGDFVRGTTPMRMPARLNRRMKNEENPQGLE
jgi:hypothetical protein